MLTHCLPKRAGGARSISQTSVTTAKLPYWWPTARSSCYRVTQSQYHTVTVSQSHSHSVTQIHSQTFTQSNNMAHNCLSVRLFQLLTGDPGAGPGESTLDSSKFSVCELKKLWNSLYKHPIKADAASSISCPSVTAVTVPDCCNMQHVDPLPGPAVTQMCRKWELWI